jgi:hypothetical protein
MAWAVWAQGLIICKACGREAKPGAAMCAHCSAPLPVPRPSEEGVKKPVAVTEDRGAEAARLARAVVEGSLRQARDLENKQTAVALCYYQNALSLMRLLPSGSLPAGVSEAVLSGNERTMRSLIQGQIPCRKCKGTGKYQLDLGKVLQKGGEVKAVDGVACPACKGTGHFAGYKDNAKAKMEILQGRQEFEKRQMVEGDVRVGRALVPAELDKVMDNRSRALVMTGMPVPCGSCQLTGRQKCLTCRGSGWVKCTFTGCENGVVKEERNASVRTSKRLNEELTKKCPKCGGLAEVVCEFCRGNGNVACKKCDGSGLAARCNRCTGTGFVTCTKCKGAGELKGVSCPECKGEKVSLCTTCRGEGALAR